MEIKKMGTAFWAFLQLLIAVFAILVNGQAPKLYAKIPDSLTECYNDTFIVVKDSLLPMTMTTLIELVRKAETLQSSMNIRTLTPAILQRFRFDGIERDPKVDLEPGIIPRRPSGHEFYLYKFLFEKLIPHTGDQIENSTFTRLERCTLHWMLSSSIDSWDRNDDAGVCNNLMKYTTYVSKRIPRDTKAVNADAEVFDPKTGPAEGEQPSGSYLHMQGKDLDYPTSSCPMENGVVYHKYGAVNPGIVLAGIASGMSPQTVSISQLSQLRSLSRPTPRGRLPRPPYRGVAQSFSPDSTVDNRWAATYSGLMAEMLLMDGPTGNMEIGIDGGWNDTIIPKYYFMSTPTKDGLTVPRIRGALDGRIMATNIQNWNSMAGTDIKLSQLLEMYYSENGIFDQDMKSCNRQKYYTQVVSMDDLSSQTNSMALSLQNELPFSVNIDDDTIKSYTDRAVNDLTTFIPQMSQITCDQNTNNKLVPKAVSDLHIVVDSTWDYDVIYQIITILVDHMQWDYKGSNLTILNAIDGNIYVNSVSSVLDFYYNFTNTNYRTARTGFDMAATLKFLKYLFQNKMEWDRQINSPGGISRIVLFIPTSSSSISDSDKPKIDKVMREFNESLPDVKFLYFVPGSVERFKPYAEDPDKDVISLGTGDKKNIQPFMQLIQRISEIPRRVTNPTCGKSWVGRNYNTLQMRGYLQRNEIQYYRIDTNYFYNNANGKVNIQSTGTTLNVCQSRFTPNPGNSSSTQGTNCTQVTPGNGVDIWVTSDLCSDASYASQCNSVFFSVAPTQAQSTSSPNRCTDDECRFPDMIKFTISQQGLSCYSGVNAIISSPIIVGLIFVIHLLKIF